MNGSDNRKYQHIRLVKGRQTYARHVAGLADTAKLLQDQANDNRYRDEHITSTPHAIVAGQEQRAPRPLVIRPLVVAVHPQTGEQKVISELRREYHPGTSEEFAEQDRRARMKDQTLRTTVGAVGLITALRGRLALLFKS